MDRKDYLLRRLNPSMKLIEIGPSHRPLLPKHAGWNTMVVDHASRAELVAKYATQSVEIADIEDVDVIWSGGDLVAKFPEGSAGTFDAIFASHVLEHMPDPISFLQSAQTLLKPNGLVILALPDKRYMFDFFGPLTTTGDWLTAHETKAITHSRRAGFNHVAYNITNGGRITWDYTLPPDELKFAHTLADAGKHFEANTDTGHGHHYHDYHAWRFTPSSFMLLMLETAVLRDIDLRVMECTPPLEYEFFVVLTRGRPAPDPQRLEAERMHLLKATIHELRQGTDPRPAAR